MIPYSLTGSVRGFAVLILLNLLLIICLCNCEAENPLKEYIQSIFKAVKAAQSWSSVFPKGNSWLTLPLEYNVCTVDYYYIRNREFSNRVEECPSSCSIFFAY